LIAFYGLPLDYLQNYIGTINSITLEQVKHAWQRHVQPDQMITVIVGGPPTATPPGESKRPAGS